MDNEKTGKIVKNVLDLVKFSINVDLTSTFLLYRQRFGPSPSPNFKSNNVW